MGAGARRLFGKSFGYATFAKNFDGVAHHLENPEALHPVSACVYAINAVP